MKTSIIHLLDFDRINTLLESFYKTTGFVTAILDLEGNILSRSSWRSICTDFHRMNAETAKKCTESDTMLANEMTKDEKYHFYKCLNGLVDVAVPLLINGEHIANLYSGQFFFEKPDRDFFINQASKYGFDTEKYMIALAKVPVYSEEQVKSAMDFLLEMTHMIADTTMQRIEQIQLNEEIRKNQLQLKAQNDALLESEANLKFIQNSSGAGMWDWDMLTNQLKWSPELFKLFGLDPKSDMATFETWDKTMHPSDKELAYKKLNDSIKNHIQLNNEYRVVHPNGNELWINAIGNTTYNSDGTPIRNAGICIDISERKQADAILHEIIDKNPISIQIVDKEGYTLLINAAHTKLFGAVPPQDYSIFKDKQIVNQGFIELFEGVKEGKSVRFPDFTFNIHDVYPELPDKPIWLRLVIFPLYDKLGQQDRYVLMHEDITERKLTEEGLIESQELFSKVFELSPAGIIITRLTDKTVRNINSSGSKLFGFQSEEMIGKSFVDLGIISSDAREKLLSEIKRNGSVHNLELTLYTKSGKPIETLYSVEPFNINGIMHNLTIVYDITNIKRTETALQQSQARFQSMFEKHAATMLIIEPESGKILDANNAASAFYGYSKSVLCSMTIDNLNMLSPEQILAERMAALNEKRNYFIFQHKLANGEIRTVEVHSSPIDFENQRVLFSIIHDISLRTRAEADLRESESKYRALIESSNDAIFSVDKDGNYKFVNQVFASTLGRTPDDFIGKSFWDIYPKEHADYRQEASSKVFETGLAGSVEVVVPLPDKNLYYLAKTNPVKNAQGEVILNLTIATDITNRKLAEVALLESEERFKALHNASFGGIAIHDKGIILECNRGLSEITGFSYEELIGMDGLSLFIDSSRNIVFDNIHSGYEKPYEAIGLRKNGEEYPVRLEARNIPYKGKMVRTVEFRDITEQKQAEETVRLSEETYRTLIENMPDGVYKTTHSGKILDLNPAMIKILGYSNKEEMLNLDIHDVLYFDPNDREQLTIAGMNKNLITYRLKRKDGSEVWVEDNGWYTFNESGEIILHEGIIRDISERRKNEQALISALERAEESEEKYKQIFDNTFDIMSIYEVTEDNRYKVITFNSAEAKLIGDIENYQNRYIDECIPPEMYEAFRKNYERCIHEDQRIEYEENISFLSVNKTFNTQLIPLKNAEGRIHRIIVISRDITENILLNTQLKQNNEELKRLNENLSAAKEHAEESDRLKSAFLANMSHEIRTPMNGILGFAELLKEPDLSGETQQEYIRIIEKSGARMLNIINDIINISKIESGLMEVNWQDSNINEQIDYMYTFFKPEVEAKGMKLIISNSLPSNEAIIKTDREKVYAILTNLVKNAIKYTNDGTIEFGYNLRNENDSAELEFYVKDTGIGIPADRLQAIFDRFIQADITDRNAYQGAGLGLSISKAYIEMLGGKIWVESEVGKGSCFYFTLPYKTDHIKKHSVSGENQNIIESTSKNKLKILIVEDDATSKLLISIAVHKFAKEILSVKNGQEAVETCSKNPDIDLVLMDIQLPILDGYEATRQIRKFNKDVVIIAQTAYALEGDKTKAIEAGCNDHITKPLNNNALHNMIIKYFKN